MKVSTAAIPIGANPDESAPGHLPGALRIGRRVFHVPARSVFDYLRQLPGAAA